jgi:hypothetical protein
MKYKGMEIVKNVQEMTYGKEKGLRVSGGDRQADF